MSKDKVMLIIPAYEPDERLLGLLQTISLDDYYVIVVDDGSGASYKHIFDEVQSFLGEHGTVISYLVNQGKGYAIKTGFTFIFENFPDAIGAITADSDGQHDAAAISSVKEAMLANKDALILGVRTFDKENMPRANYLANRSSNIALQIASGVKVSDSQTGLRGIPKSFMQELLEIKENRFEFEMKMLAMTHKKCEIVETPISLIYDSLENHSTHFRPVRDLTRVMGVLFGEFLGFIFSSLSSAAIDVGLFYLFCSVLPHSEGVFYVTMANIIARIISSMYNFAINYKLVFNSNADKKTAALKYFILVLIQMFNSTWMVSLAAYLMPKASEVVIKIIVDLLIFFINYLIQKRLVFIKDKKSE